MTSVQHVSSTPASSYLAYLPAAFRSDPFLGRFLLAFERILSDGDGDPPGLETTIGSIARVLDPDETEPEFLPWLAGWVALSLRADWDVATRRRFIREIVPLYRLRGTKAGLEGLLRTFTGDESVVVDDAFEQVPHYFQVRMVLREPDPDKLRDRQQTARAIIDQEKPAHTFYALRVAVPTMRLVSKELSETANWPLLILGGNTLLGSTVPEPQ